MYCESFADKKWLARVERRRLREERLAIAMERDTADQVKLFTKVAVEEDLEVTVEEAGEIQEGFDADAEQLDKQNNDKQSKKRKRCVNTEKKTKRSEDMPEDWQHLRHSIRKVREVYYTTVDELMSVNHMSYEQAIVAVVTVGRRMFGLAWKRFEEGKVIPGNTAPPM